jgi:hypothetical protein
MKSIALGFSVLCCALIMLAWSQPTRASEVVATCYAVDVATFSDRVHIHCGMPNTGCSSPTGTGYCTAKPPSEPPYFAVETSSAMAAGVVQSGIWSLNSKRALEIHYDDNADENPAGCLQQDCRRIIGVIAR